MSENLDEYLACPLCGGRLTASGAGLHCRADRASFPIYPPGLLDLRPPANRAEAQSFVARYRADRLAEGWQPLAPASVLGLPEGNPPGFSRVYWPLRRESWVALASLLASRGAPPLRVADLGAGLPWLSHRLAELGHAVVALDLSPDTHFGLGAALHYPTSTIVRTGLGIHLTPGHFLPVLGDLAQPPLASQAYDAVICNASLHYVRDLSSVVGRIAARLRPGGALFVVDSPIAAMGRTGDRVGSRVLGRDELDAALAGAGLSPRWLQVRRGWLWRWHQIKTWLRRQPGFDFPIVVGSSGPSGA